MIVLIKWFEWITNSFQVRNLCMAVCVNATIRHGMLFIQCCFHIVGIMDVLLALEENKGLVVLSLEGNDMRQQPAVVRPGNEGGVARGFSGLLHERTDLRVLRVGATGINLAGVHLIMSALEENDHLMEFEIGFKNIGLLSALHAHHHI